MTLLQHTAKATLAVAEQAPVQSKNIIKKLIFLMQAIVAFPQHIFKVLIPSPLSRKTIKDKGANYTFYSSCPTQNHRNDPFST